MTSAPRAFSSVMLLLALWVMGRSAIVAYGHFAPVDAISATAIPVAEAAVSPAIVAVRASSSVSTQQHGPALPLPPIWPPPRHLRLRAAAIDYATGIARMPIAALSPSVQSDAASPMAGTMPRAYPSARSAQWSASSWLVYRGSGGGGGLAPSGQLGGSQAGARLWAGIAQISSTIPIGATLRASTALSKKAQREIAPGISARVGGPLPLEIIAERRLGIGGNALDRFALIAATGIDDRRIASGLFASGYMQAGVAGMRSRDGFVDGAARVERLLFAEGGLSVRAGVNAWGAAQPGLSRLDLGPNLTLKISSPGPPLRISAEWRQRVAGNATPGSGPAITIGTDF